MMNWALEEKPMESKQLQLHVSLDSTEQKAYDIIRTSGQISIDNLSLQLKWPQSKLAITLLELEMKSVIAALPGKVYRAI